MSAFLCSDRHVHELVRAGLFGPSNYAGKLSWYWGNPSRRTELDSANADGVATMLRDENVRSLTARYPDDEHECAIGSVPLFRPFALSPVQVLKAIHCYEYQTCETDDWDTTEAHAFCRALERRTMAALRGYDAAEWSLSEYEDAGITR